MATVFDVAKYILHRKKKLSTWKLQKLCYYAQAWSIAWTEHPLFAEDFEAWVNGPVCPELYHAHQGKFEIAEADLPKGDRDALSADEKETVDAVLDTYGDWEPYELKEQTHHEPPWRDARKGLPETAYSRTVISKDSMGAYYGSL